MTESTTTRRLSEQDRAVLLLTQARDLLAQRLTTAILELGDDLLEDARGESFAGEIDTLHDQIGTRLSQVNVLLAGLSAPDEFNGEMSRRLTAPAQTESSQPEISAEGGAVVQHVAGGSLSTDGSFSTSTYPLFVQDIVRRDLVAAGRRLAEVLETTPTQAEVYATRFRDQLDRDPAFLAKVHRLRTALQREDHNLARALLGECFDLQGMECQAAMLVFRSWL